MYVQLPLIKYYMEANYFQKLDSYKCKHPLCLEILCSTLEKYSGKNTQVSRFPLQFSSVRNACDQVQLDNAWER